MPPSRGPRPGLGLRTKGQSPDSRLSALPAFPPPEASVASSGSLPGHSGGTVPDSHRLPGPLRPLFVIEQHSRAAATRQHESTLRLRSTAPAAPCQHVPAFGLRLSARSSLKAVASQHASSLRLSLSASRLGVGRQARESTLPSAAVHSVRKGKAATGLPDSEPFRAKRADKRRPVGPERAYHAGGGRLGLPPPAWYNPCGSCKAFWISSDPSRNHPRVFWIS